MPRYTDFAPINTSDQTTVPLQLAAVTLRHAEGLDFGPQLGCSDALREPNGRLARTYRDAEVREGEVIKALLGMNPNGHSTLHKRFKRNSRKANEKH